LVNIVVSLGSSLCPRRSQRLAAYSGHDSSEATHSSRLPICTMLRE
jgi:hypothetical protein